MPEAKSVTIGIKRKQGAKDLPLPRYITPGASGMDLYADIQGELLLQPGRIKLVSCGIYLRIPPGFEAEIRPRSGLALKHGVTLVNAPGTIDSDYRGLVSLIMINLGNSDFKMKRGDRVAQMVVKEVRKADFAETENLDETVRSSGGFGHTGL